MNEAQNNPIDPYLEMKFEEFLKEIGNANIKNWTILAEALGVGRKTIYRWRHHPLAKEAINTAISESIEKMEKVGHDDWKMHREKAKMLGVKDRQTIEHEVDPETMGNLLDQLETNYGKLGATARQAIDGQVVANEPPIQNQE
ncbi:MAG: hypothetical protein WC871_02235 [Bacteroidales bacterium]|jgi:hypothetical protein